MLGSLHYCEVRSRYTHNRQTHARDCKQIYDLNMYSFGINRKRKMAMCQVNFTDKKRSGKDEAQVSNVYFIRI